MSVFRFYVFLGGVLGISSHCVEHLQWFYLQTATRFQPNGNLPNEKLLCKIGPHFK